MTKAIDDRVKEVAALLSTVEMTHAALMQSHRQLLQMDQQAQSRADTTATSPVAASGKAEFLI